MIEYALFKYYTPCFEQLKQYGFVRKDEKYISKTYCYNNQFQAVVEVSEQGGAPCAVQGKVFDLANCEEYLPLQIENWQGSFVNEVRSAYKDILLAIRERCFIKNHFIYPQSNRITSLIKEEYGDEPLFLWDKYPNCAVFKNPESNKWYGAVLGIDAVKIDETKAGEIEILDIKADKKNVQELLQEQGFYPAYHMNKKSWLTIILDESISDDRIMELIAESYAFTLKKPRKTK